MAKKFTPAKIEKMAKEIRDFLNKHELWEDVRIYFNGKAYATDDGKGNYSYNDPNKLYVLEDVDPRDYFEYVGDILSMSFEGGLYDLLNYEFGKTYNEFNELIKKFGCYYELGNAWNLSLYEI